jgi:hypothetical protein
MLAQCPCWESSGASDATEAGTDRHAALADLFAGNDELLTLLEDEQADAVRWAAEYIRLKAPLLDEKIWFETKLQIMDGMEGTADCMCGDQLFDLKWRFRDYNAQMAAYALGMFRLRPEFPFVQVHLLFGESRESRTYRITKEEAEAVVAKVIAYASMSDKKPTPCDYCGWCSRQIGCSAYTERAAAVVDGREDWKLEQYHSSQISDPAEMSKALTMAKQLSKWCEAVEFKAKEMAVKDGVTIPGYKLQTRQGNQFVVDIAAAFQLAGLPQDKFLDCCNVVLTKLGETYATFTGQKKAPGVRELNQKLAAVIDRKPSTVSLVKEGKKQDGNV